MTNDVPRETNRSRRRTDAPEKKAPSGGTIGSSLLEKASEARHRASDAIGSKVAGLGDNLPLPKGDGSKAEMAKGAARAAGNAAKSFFLSPTVVSKGKELSTGEKAIQIITRWYPAICIFFCEIVLKLSSSAGLFPQVLYMLLFSIVAGQIVWVLSSVTGNRTIDGIIRTVLLAVVGLLFCIFYFIFRKFGMFYDIKTVRHGAGGVATGFMGDVIKMIFSPSGLLHIVLFLAPAVVWFLLFRRLDARRASLRDLLTSLAGAVCVWLVSLILILPSPTFGPLYSSRFTFNSGVSSFGLLTALRRDATIGIFGGNTSFEEVDTSQEEPSDSTRPYNVMDIDFDELAQSDSGYADTDAYVASLAPTRQNEYTGMFAGYNVIFISAEAFSAEAIRPDTTPTLYRMATQGIQFTDYYQFASAGTTGGECCNIFGVHPIDGGESIVNLVPHNNYFTLGNALNRLGYEGWMFHNNTYTFYERDYTHNLMGYNHGYMGLGNGMEAYVTPQWPESDLEMVRGTYDDIYGASEPYNVYYMSVSGHSNYSREDNDMSKLYWDEVEGLDYSEPVRAYLACNIDLDRAMEYLIGRLEETGQADHTVIVISADHFPYGLDDDAPLGQMPYLSELYGYDVETVFQRDHNRLIVWSGSLEGKDPIVVDDPVSSLDVLPTMLNLLGVEYDSRLLPGRDVFSDSDPLVFTVGYDWRTNLGTYIAATGTFTPVIDGAQVPDEYVNQMNAIVSNKLSFCRVIVETDYYDHIFGPSPDTQQVHDDAVAAMQPAQADASADSADGDSGGKDDAD